MESMPVRGSSLSRHPRPSARSLVLLVGPAQLAQLEARRSSHVTTTGSVSGSAIAGADGAAGTAARGAATSVVGSEAGIEAAAPARASPPQLRPSRMESPAMALGSATATVAAELSGAARAAWRGQSAREKRRTVRTVVPQRQRQPRAMPSALAARRRTSGRRFPRGRTARLPTCPLVQMIASRAAMVGTPLHRKPRTAVAVAEAVREMTASPPPLAMAPSRGAGTETVGERLTKLREHVRVYVCVRESE